MKSANPENEYIPLDLRISVRRDTLRLISEMAQDMGISINEVFSFLAEDSVIDLELMAEAYGVKQKIASKILFTTTLISIITIPILKMFMNLFIQTN